MQAFFIRGKVAAVFVKYSPSLRKAVFAVAPGIHVSGPVTCRVQNGACRYLDIPAGSYARLTMLTAKREIVRRRLDVEHITRRTSSQKTAAAAQRIRRERLLPAQAAGDEARQRARRPRRLRAVGTPCRSAHTSATRAA